jgi:hypothetical protein
MKLESSNPSGTKAIGLCLADANGGSPREISGEKLKYRVKGQRMTMK